jgi:hypothetical protein
MGAVFFLGFLIILGVFFWISVAGIALFIHGIHRLKHKDKLPTTPNLKIKYLLPGLVWLFIGLATLFIAIGIPFVILGIFKLRAYSKYDKDPILSDKKHKNYRPMSGKVFCIWGIVLLLIPIGTRVAIGFSSKNYAEDYKKTNQFVKLVDVEEDDFYNKFINSFYLDGVKYVRSDTLAKYPDRLRLEKEPIANVRYRPYLLLYILAGGEQYFNVCKVENIMDVNILYIKAGRYKKPIIYFPEKRLKEIEDYYLNLPESEIITEDINTLSYADEEWAEHSSDFIYCEYINN